MLDGRMIEDVALAAKRIMQAEYRHNFEVHPVDDSEHVPRMARIADSVRDALLELGVSELRCNQVRDGLLQYARELYIAEWMEPQPGDDEDNPPREEDAIDAFNSFLETKSRKP